MDTVVCEHVESIRNFIDAEGGALAHGLVQSFVTLEGAPRENQVEEWGHRLLQHFLRVTLEELVDRDKPPCSLLRGDQTSAANHQLPSPVSVNRPSSAASHSATRSQRLVSTNITPTISQDESLLPASSILPSNIQQGTSQQFSESYNMGLSFLQNPDSMMQSFELEGTTMHPSNDSGFDSSFYSQFWNDAA